MFEEQNERRRQKLLNVILQSPCAPARLARSLFHIQRAE